MKSRIIVCAFVALLSFTSTVNANTSEIASSVNINPVSLANFGENGNEWTLVKNENGLETYYQTIPKDGVFQLRVKFVNTTNNAIAFNWSIHRGSDALFSGVENTVGPSASVEKDEELVIPFSTANDSFQDYTITINLK